MCLLAALAGCVACTDRAQPAASPDIPIDSLSIFVRNAPAQEYVELVLARAAGQNTAALFRPPGPGRPRIMLDSSGPAATYPDRVVTMLDSFDIWEMNAPDAPGAACMTVEGERICTRPLDDYSLVMMVQSAGQVRVQRYIGLEKDASDRRARALGDFLLEWARQAGPPEDVHPPASPGS